MYTKKRLIAKQRKTWKQLFVNHGPTVEKITINRLIANYLEKDKKNEDVVVGMDTPMLLSVIFLQSAGFTKDDIHLAIFDDKNYQEIKQLNQATVHKLYLADLFFQLRKSKYEQKVKLLFSDYTTMPYDDDTVHPLDDVKLFFDLKLAAHAGLLCLTYKCDKIKDNKEEIDKKNLVVWRDEQLRCYSLARLQLSANRDASLFDSSENLDFLKFLKNLNFNIHAR